VEERWRKGGRKEGRAETCHNNEFLFKDYGITDYYCTLDKTLFVLTILRKRVHVGGVPQRQEEDQGGKVGSEEKKEKGGRQTKIETEKRQGEQNLISTVSEYSIVPN